MDLKSRFRALHEDGCFIMPNPWDRGSAKRLESMGFPALATTSSGHAESFGRTDQQITADEMIEHAAEVVAVTSVPLNVDSERLFTEELPALGSMVEAIAATGAAGCSIEDYRPDTRSIDPLDLAVARVRVAADAAASTGIVLTARAEAILYTDTGVDEVIERLVRFREAGADVVYAPGLKDPSDIAKAVGEAGCPVNVLLWPGGPDVAELAQLGVRRISTGGALMRTAYDALEESAARLLPGVREGGR
jgi:2-methylisocitrate lyase-like PEP mutase family enzyme